MDRGREARIIPKPPHGASMVVLRRRASRPAPGGPQREEPVDLLRREADIAVRMVRPKQGALLTNRVGEERSTSGRCTAPILNAVARLRASPIRRATPSSATTARPLACARLRTLGLTLTRDQFAYRTDKDLAQLNLIRAGAGIGVCQVGLAKRDPNLVRILAKEFFVPLEAWITMRQDLRGAARIRATFDHLVRAMMAYARAR